jgi:hypothetical protein
MQITESQLRQQVKLLLKEEVYGTIATVYHGSKQPPEEFLKLFETGDLSNYKSTGWAPGQGVGSSYGHGLYSVWIKTNHQTFKGGYGNWVYKLKVNLHGFIIFDEDVCQKVYKKSITPLEQMKLIGKEQELRKASKEEIRVLSSLPVKDDRSADLALRASSFLRGRVNGIVFFGWNDGPVVLIYDPDIATPMAWTKRDINTGELDPWTSWNASEIKQSLKRASSAGAQVNPERLQAKVFDINPYMNNFVAFNGIYNKINEEQKILIARKTENKDILMKLVKDVSNNVRASAASNRKISAEMLVQLAGDKNTSVRITVARNENTPVETLIQLLKDKSKNVIEAVASNKNVPEELSMQLAESKEKQIRLNVARYNTSTKVLAKLSEDLLPSVRLAVAHNMNTSPEILAQLAGSKETQIRTGVALNRNTQPEILVKLSQDKQSSPRWGVAYNPNTSVDILMKLSNDKEEDVKTKALENLQSRQSINELKSLIRHCI